MKFKFIAHMDWSMIHIIPILSMSLYQPNLIDMNRFWTHTNFIVSFSFLGFVAALKIYIEQ